MASARCHTAVTPSTRPCESLRVSRGSCGGFATLSFDTGSGYLDAEELGVLFKNMRMPMGQRELDDIVDEIDVDGNGVVQRP